MRTRMLVHGEFEQIEAVFLEVELLLGRKLRLAKIGREVRMQCMRHVLDCIMSTGQCLRGRKRRTGNGGHTSRGRAFEEIAAGQHLFLHRIHHANVAHGSLLTFITREVYARVWRECNAT